jgi:hypothetical protein
MSIEMSSIRPECPLGQVNYCFDRNLVERLVDWGRKGPSTFLNTQW